MTPLRALAITLIASMALPVHAAQTPGSLLSDRELAAVHAAGLSEPALRGIELGMAEGPAAQMPWLDAAAHADRQQSLAQVKFAALATQGSVSLVQTATMATVALPLAALFLPSLVLPFPLMMLPPPKKAEPGH
ncbi:MAG: hypothetical protein KF891_01410 [Rhizobacter sp.]|nr:hypothetical protein [Rhizobacter sp.]